jgi:hypothetical protein
MKRSEFIRLIIIAMLVIASTSCKKEGHYALEQTPPLDFRSYYDGLKVTFSNATDGATGISWDFGDSSPVVTGDSVSHTYENIGNYLITMNGNYQGRDWNFHTMLRVDKASVVDLDDGSFSDWDNVTYPEFMLSGKGTVDTAKVDYDANYIYFYVEFDSLASNAGIMDHIFGVYMDADNSVSTGFAMKEMGVDYSCEGNIWNGGWLAPSVVDLANGDPGWPFVGFDNPDALKPGFVTKEGNTIKMEFGISREVFRISSDAMAFSMSIMNADWSDVGNLVTPLPEFSEKIVVIMNKTTK